MFIYSFLFYCILPLILLRLLWRGFKAPQYWQRWPERFGIFKLDAEFKSSKQKTIWLHAVSVGEVLASRELVEQCLKKYKNSKVVMTTMTPTGSDQVRRLFGGRVFHVYAPYDLPGNVNRFLKKIKPDLFLIMETEIWPNMIVKCNKKNIPIVLVNGRLSEKSLGRYQKFPSFSSFIFNKINTICAQSDADKKRFSALMHDNAKHIMVTGSIKADIKVNDIVRKQALGYRLTLEKDAKRLIVLAASTHKDEDEILLSAYKKLKPLFPSLLLVLVPRHPERFNSVAELCRQEKLAVARKYQNDVVSDQTDVLLADTMGELFMLFGACDIAVMGGTFIEHGGHNPLEPAAWGLPIVSGQSDYNFALATKELIEVGALYKVEGVDDLARTTKELLQSTLLRRSKGQAAIDYIEKNSGALNRVFGVIESLIQKN